MSLSRASGGKRILAGAALAALLVGCSGDGGAAATASPAAPGYTGPATAEPSTGGPAASPGQPVATPPAGGGVDPYNLPPGEWTAGVLHVEVTGGIELELDLPIASGETASGRTTLIFENHEDNEFSKGRVLLSWVVDAHSIGIEVGDVRVQGPCEFTFSAANASQIEATLACSDDLGATVAGDPREAEVTGTFTGAP